MASGPDDMRRSVRDCVSGNARRLNRVVCTRPSIIYRVVRTGIRNDNDNDDNIATTLMTVGLSVGGYCAGLAGANFPSDRRRGNDCAE